MLFRGEVEALQAAFCSRGGPEVLDLNALAVVRRSPHRRHTLSDTSPLLTRTSDSPWSSLVAVSVASRKFRAFEQRLPLPLLRAAGESQWGGGLRLGKNNLKKAPGWPRIEGASGVCVCRFSLSERSSFQEPTELPAGVESA